MNAWNTMLHQFAALCNAPFASHLCYRSIILAFLYFSNNFLCGVIEFFLCFFKGFLIFIIERENIETIAFEDELLMMFLRSEENTPEQIDRAADLLKEYFPLVVVN